jgi:hypothetical protein
MLCVGFLLAKVRDGHAEDGVRAGRVWKAVLAYTEASRVWCTPQFVCAAGLAVSVVV